MRTTWCTITRNVSHEQEYINRFLENLAKFSIKVRRRYTIDLEHYGKTALMLSERFNDNDLTMAGFLHGVPSSELLEFFKGDLKDEIFRIIKERENSHSFNLFSF